MHRRHFIAASLATATLRAQQPERKLETTLMLPEPRAMRNALSTTAFGARLTIFTPAQETAKGIETYTEEVFRPMGFSVETFMKRAKTAADRRLATLKPEIIRDDAGKPLYAVYRGEASTYASLLFAPSLPKVFEAMFGKEIWVALPDRHALYIFPAQSAALQEFTEDLASRYAEDPFAASPEIFSLKAGEEPKVIASFTGEE